MGRLTLQSVQYHINVILCRDLDSDVHALWKETIKCFLLEITSHYHRVGLDAAAGPAQTSVAYRRLGRLTFIFPQAVKKNHTDVPMFCCHISYS